MTHKKPSERIDELAEIFRLSNTVGSSQLEYMQENREKILDQFAGKYIQKILDYLDEEWKELQQPSKEIKSEGKGNF